MAPQTKLTWFQKIENMHPYQTLVYLGMFGSGLIFLFMMLAFFVSRPDAGILNHYSIPDAFIASTFTIILSGFYVSRLIPHYQGDNTEGLKNALWTTFLLGIVFTALQFLGWKELQEMGVDFKGYPAGSFIYVLSGIHIFHLLGAMIFALFLLTDLKKTEGDEIKHLYLLVNPYEKMRLKLFATYWYYMDAIWGILFLIFLLAL
ncbi:cytochrome c oxidase subunit 3 [Pararhodonellum marinum]|uniref:cytochrome c oxidase subunit 3 n=1 Tax=Pararhodonellum marinum TaxID=2755358 RepID=UPI00188F41F7|nr:cytochrome C oxidase subunit III [Pararhodonellum marinum]